MKLILSSILLILCHQVDAQGPTVAGYSFVNDYSNSYLRADSDVKLLSSYVDKVTQVGFDNALNLYEKGAHFRPQVIVSIGGSGTPGAIASKEALSGKNSTNAVVNLTSSTSYPVAAKNLTLNYAKNNECILGGLAVADQVTFGCLATSGDLITNAGAQIVYTSPIGSLPARSMKAFTVTAQIMTGVDGKLYPDFQTFLDYYGKADYPDIYIMAALKAEPTTFVNGNIDFTGKAFLGRNQAVKKGAAYMTYYMHAIRYFYSGQQTCGLGLFEEGVALYIGGLEGPSGTNGKGFMPYTLADKRCENFKTCGAAGNALTGIGNVNVQMLALFNEFKAQYNASACPTITNTTLLPIIKNITNLMKVPMIQATIRYADEVARGNPPTYATRAEGAVFAAGLLPYVHKCNATDASSILTLLTTGTGENVLVTIKAALEKNYKCMGVKCADVGGLVDLSGAYKNNTKPCVDAVTPPPPPPCKKRGASCRGGSVCCSKRCRGIIFRRCG